MGGAVWRFDKRPSGCTGFLNCETKTLETQRMSPVKIGLNKA